MADAWTWYATLAGGRVVAETDDAPFAELAPDLTALALVHRDGRIVEVQPERAAGETATYWRRRGIDLDLATGAQRPAPTVTVLGLVRADGGAVYLHLDDAGGAILTSRERL